MRVLVTDGDNRAALAVTRSLGRAGHEVIVGAAKDGKTLASASRYCAGRLAYPDPVSASERFVDVVAEQVRDLKVGVVMPVADITTFLIAGHRDRFEPSCAIPLAPAEVIERAADKVRVIETANRLGVPVPHSIIVEAPDRIPDRGIEFPTVVKPWRSRVRTPTGWAATAVSYARNRDALRRDLAARPRHEFPVMLQERIEGPGMGIFACYHRGEPVALFSHRRLRERPPWGGVSVLCESVPMPAIARDHATSLLSAIGWHGVAMVEFKLDRRDQQPKLMEINGRFWGSLQLAIDSGVDFPMVLMRTLAPGFVGPQDPYRTGVRSRWIWGDFDSMLQVVLPRNGSPRLGPVQRVAAVLRFMEPWRPGLYYDNPKWSDPGPFAFETGERMRQARRHFAQRGKAASAPLATVQPPNVSSVVTTRTVRGLDQVGLDERAWNALAAHSETNTIFQTHQWMRSWLETYRDQFKPRLVIAAHGDETIGVLPLILHESSHNRVLRFAGDVRADYCDLLAPTTRRDAVDAMLGALLDDDSWDVIDLRKIPAASSLPDNLRRICRERGLSAMIQEHLVCPTLLIDGHEQAARLIIDKPSVRRSQRAFERAGVVAVHDTTSASDIEPRLDSFFDQHVARWSGTENPSLFLDGRHRRFYRALTRALDGTGWLLFSEIGLNSKAAAYHFGFDYHGALLWYKPSFDIGLAPLSPGIAMVRHLVQYALGHGRRELDFTVGDERFKKRFTNYTRMTVRVQIFRRTLHSLDWKARHAVGAVLRKVRAGALLS